MNELEINRQRAQLLVKARALLNEEYLKNRTTEYEQWQADSNRMWISQGILLPCPNKFTYPTEEAVVSKALELYNKQALSQAPTVSGVQLPETAVDMTSSVSAKLAEVSQKFTPVVLPEVPSITPWEQYLGPAVEQPVEPVAAPIDIPLPEVVVKPEPTVEDVVAKDEPEEVETVEDSSEPMTDDEIIEEARKNSNLRILLAKFINVAKGLDAKARKDEGTPI